MEIEYQRLQSQRADFFKQINEQTDLFANQCLNFENELSYIGYHFITINNNYISFLYQNISCKIDDLREIIFNFANEIDDINVEINEEITNIANQYHVIKNNFCQTVDESINEINYIMSHLQQYQNFVDTYSPEYVKNRVQQIKNHLDYIKKSNLERKDEINALQNIYKNIMNMIRNKCLKVISIIKNDDANFQSNKAKINCEISYICQNIQKQIQKKNETNNFESIRKLIHENNLKQELAENEIENLRKKLLKEIKELKDQHSKEREDHINIFKSIHDGICNCSADINELRKSFINIQLANKEQIENLEKIYHLEKDQIKETINEILNLSIKFKLMINDFENSNNQKLAKIKSHLDNSYSEKVHLQQKEIEQLQESQSKELKDFEYHIEAEYKQKYKELTLIINQEIDNKILETKEKYEKIYNELLNELSLPVFSTAIGYQKSQELVKLHENKSSLINRIHNERNLMMIESPDKAKIFGGKNEIIKPDEFMTLHHKEKIFLNQLCAAIKDSNTMIAKKENEFFEDILKLENEINFAKRVYLTKKLYILDEIEPSPENKLLLRKLNDDELIDKQITSLKTQIHKNKHKPKSNKAAPLSKKSDRYIYLTPQKNPKSKTFKTNREKIELLDNKLEQTNDTFINLYKKLIKVKNRKKQIQDDNAITKVLGQKPTFKSKASIIAPSQTNRPKTGIARKISDFR